MFAEKSCGRNQAIPIVVGLLLGLTGSGCNEEAAGEAREAKDAREANLLLLKNDRIEVC
jgi:hypothetical protein